MVYVAQRLIKQGLTKAVNRDDSEPILMWLDRLAIKRTDWHPWVTETWRRLLSHPSPVVAGAAVDTLYFGRTGFVSLAMLKTLSTYFQTTSIVVNKPNNEVPYSLGEIVELIQKRQAYYTDESCWMMLCNPSFQWFKIETVEDAIALAQRAAKEGRSLVGGYGGMSQPLDWLRKLVVLSPRCRTWAPIVLESMLAGDDSELAAACQYLVQSPESWMTLPGLLAALEKSPQLGKRQPILCSVARSRCPVQSFLELATWLQKRVEKEIETSPQPENLIAFASQSRRG